VTFSWTKYLFFILVILAGQASHAFQTDPSKLNILKCMAAYQYDFVAEELGFTIGMVDAEGKEIPRPDDASMEKLKVSQALNFIAKKHLQPRAPLPKKKTRSEKDFERRCQILAETVIEIMIVKGQLEPEEPDSGPAPIEQSL
jgi:hypothetical protein